MSDWTQDLAVGWELLLLTLTAASGYLSGFSCVAPGW